MREGVARYEGFWIRLNCSECETIFEVEHDVSNGEELECPNCRANLEVEGR